MTGLADRLAARWEQVPASRRRTITAATILAGTAAWVLHIVLALTLISGLPPEWSAGWLVPVGAALALRPHPDDPDAR